MKKIHRSLIVAVLLATLLTMAVSASPLAGSTTKQLSSNYTLVNLSSSPAIVNAAYYKPDGSPWETSESSKTIKLNANFGQAIVAQYFDPAMTSGAGSVVLSSEQKIGAVAQILARGQTPSSGAYSAISKPSGTYYVPQVFSKRFTQSGTANSQIIVQNTDTEAHAATVKFVPFPGMATMNTHEKTQTIPAGSSWIYDLADENGLVDTSGAGWSGSAVVTASTGTVGVVVNTFMGQNLLQTYNGFPAESASTALEFPQFTSKLPNGLNIPLIIQNVGDTIIPAGDLKLNCVPVPGYNPEPIQKFNTTEVLKGGLFAFNPVGDPSYPENWSGACSVVSQSGAKIVGIAQMRNPGVNENVAVYEGIPSSSTDTTVVVPLISKNQSNGFATAAVIKNLDKANTASVTLTFYPSATYISAGGSGTPVTFDAEIPANGNLVQSQRFTGTPELPDGWYGSLVVRPKDISNARPLAAVVQLTNTIIQPGDTLMAHLAFTLP